MGLFDKIRQRRQKRDTDAVPQKTAKVGVPKEAAKKEVKEVKKEAEHAGVAKADALGSAYRVIVRPYVSEKAATHETHGEYSFVVDSRATKEEIKRAVEALYGVSPERVRTVNVEGKMARFRGQGGRKSDWKKAMVQLPTGTTIDIHEGV